MTDPGDAPLRHSTSPYLIRTVHELRSVLAPARQRGQRIGLVPTMGALHAGHRSLMERARAESDVVVVSIFVNPKQFDQQSDLASYPRTEEADVAVAAAAGVDLIFAPDVAEVYPPGFNAEVRLNGPLVDTLEGTRRGTDHFHGVTTVVSKLFGMAQPSAAYFGAKDAQQALVISTMVKDLNQPIEIVICPTVRDPDGLALSSRNQRLDPAARRRAQALPAALHVAAGLVTNGVVDSSQIITEATAQLSEVDLEYFVLVDPDTLAPMPDIDGPVLALVAAWVDGVRLIDNELLIP